MLPFSIAKIPAYRRGWIADSRKVPDQVWNGGYLLGLLASNYQTHRYVQSDEGIAPGIERSV